MNIKSTALVLFLSVPSAFSYQDNKQHKVNQKEIDEAINKGVKYLLKLTEEYIKIDINKTGTDFATKHFWSSTLRAQELILYTLVHAGVSEKDETFKKLLEKVLSKKPDEKQTYNLAIEAMALYSLDPKKHFNRIGECAQALVNRQCKNGQWTYGATKKDYETPQSNSITTPNGPKEISVKRQGWGPEKGDNSNSQYAALGLRACFETGIKIDQDVLKLAKTCWEKCQNNDGGWDYYYKDNSKSTGVGPDSKDKSNQSSTGSMTVGAMGALASYKHMLKEDYKKDPKIQKAIEWVSKYFSVEKNPQVDSKALSDHHFYYLYGLERSGALVAVEKFGNYDWYSRGAEYLLKNQKSEGFGTSKPQAKDSGQRDLYAPVDTCFAILFLKKATEHLIETGR